MGLLLALYLACAALAVVQAFLMALQTYEHRRYARRRMAELCKPAPRGRACLLIPCKGLDEDLEPNLAALLEQDYPDYEVRFLVEGPDDPACQAIRRTIAAHPKVTCRVVFTGRAEHSGQKVHNLICGVRDIPPQVEYLAFADSDAQPRPEWLRWLLYRLDEPGVAATTGYRWFLPVSATLANYLLYSVNSVVALFMGPRSWHYVWGGSWAMRRETFAELAIAEAWQGTLSDDLVVAAVVRRASRKTIFHPPCMVASPADYDLAGLLRFIRRQYMVMRFYSTKMWAFALAAAVIPGISLVAGVTFAAWLAYRGSPWAWLPAGLTALQYGLGIVRGHLRQDLVRTYFPQHRETLRAARRFDVWLNPLAALVHAAGIAASAAGRHMVWRGITYRLHFQRPIERIETRSVSEDRSPVAGTSLRKAG